MLERYADPENGDLDVKGLAENYAGRFFDLVNSCQGIVSDNATPYIKAALGAIAPQGRSWDAQACGTSPPQNGCSRGHHLCRIAKRSPRRALDARHVSARRREPFCLCPFPLRSPGGSRSPSSPVLLAALSHHAGAYRELARKPSGATVRRLREISVVLTAAAP